MEETYRRERETLERRIAELEGLVGTKDEEKVRGCGGEDNPPITAVGLKEAEHAAEGTTESVEGREEEGGKRGESEGEGVARGGPRHEE